MKRLIIILAVLVGMMMAGSSADAGWRRRVYRRAYYGTGPNYNGGYNQPYYSNGYYNNGYYPRYYNSGYYNGYYNNGYYATPGAAVVTPGGAVGVGVY